VVGLMWHVLLICHVRRLNANASQSESDFDLDFDFDTASHSASTQSDSKYFCPENELLCRDSSRMWVKSMSKSC